MFLSFREVARNLLIINILQKLTELLLISRVPIPRLKGRSNYFRYHPLCAEFAKNTSNSEFQLYG